MFEKNTASITYICLPLQVREVNIIPEIAHTLSHTHTHTAMGDLEQFEELLLRSARNGDVKTVEDILKARKDGKIDLEINCKGQSCGVYCLVCVCGLLNTCHL